MWPQYLVQVVLSEGWIHGSEVWIHSFIGRGHWCENMKEEDTIPSPPPPPQ